MKQETISIVYLSIMLFENILSNKLLQSFFVISLFCIKSLTFLINSFLKSSSFCKYNFICLLEHSSSRIFDYDLFISASKSKIGCSNNIPFKLFFNIISKETPEFPFKLSINICFI